MTVTVRELLEAGAPGLGLRLVAGGRGLQRPIALPRLQQPGLALAGFLPQLHPDRIQVLGNSEVSYLETLGPERARQAVAAVAAAGVACFVVTNGAPPPAPLVQAAEAADVPMLTTALRTSDFIRAASTWLEERLAPETQLHADLVEVQGLGTLILGKSGIGKSEAALDLVTRGHRLVADDVPVLATARRTSEFIRAASAWLEEQLAPETQLHADLVEVQGLGTLILGKSGIGKSEAALDLVTHGHRLVADDIVIVRRISPTVLRGRAAERLSHHMEIRGLGIIDVEALFGTLATLDERQLDLVVELVEWTDTVDRLGLIEERYTLLELPLPMVRIPVRPGRSMALLIETAARNHLLRRRGRHSAVEFTRRIDRDAAGG